MPDYQQKLARMRARRSTLTSMLKQYYENWLKRFEADNGKFAESAVRVAEEHQYAPPVRHYAAQ